jgi:citrate lyase subunit beta/citryl-CoA lyase
MPHNRMRRALLFMPGDSRRKIEKGAGLGVDSIIMDLEDAIALNNKDVARASVAQALRESRLRTHRKIGTHQHDYSGLDLPARHPRNGFGSP